MSKRVYVGKLSMDATPEDVKTFFSGYGTMTDCRILTGFGFVEFETEKDADEVVRNFNGRNFMGSDLIVEFAKESRARRNDDRGGGGGGYNSERGPRYGRGPKVPGIRLVVSGVSRDTSWQDLKDFARQAGHVTFADIDRDVPNQGLIEYANREEAERAIQELDNQDIRGSTVRVALDTRRSGGDRGGGDRGGGGYSSRGGGRDRWDGGGHGGRRDRSRSPRRGGGGYDDRRSSRYDDRRDRHDDRDRDRDDRRRDDRDRRGGGGGGGGGGERAPERAPEREDRY